MTNKKSSATSTTSTTTYHNNQDPRQEQQKEAAVCCCLVGHRPSSEMVSMFTKIPVKKNSATGKDKKRSRMNYKNATFVRAGDVNLIEDNMLEGGAVAETIYFENEISPLLRFADDANEHFKEYGSAQRRVYNSDQDHDDHGVEHPSHEHSHAHALHYASTSSQHDDLQDHDHNLNDVHIDDYNHDRKRCRSSLYVEGMCCPLEIPKVTSILKKAGVEKVSINITSRLVFVDHFEHRINATEISIALGNGGFPASIRKDGGVRNKRNAKILDVIGSSSCTRQTKVRSPQSTSLVLPKALGFNILLSGIFWVVSLVSGLNGKV